MDGRIRIGDGATAADTPGKENAIFIVFLHNGAELNNLKKNAFFYVSFGKYEVFIMASRKNTTELNKAEKKLLQLAKEHGVEQDYLFSTTFQRYKTQLAILDRLQKELKNCETMVSRTYIKGNTNMTTNPLFKEYSGAASDANKTAALLLRIIKTFSGGSIMEAANEPEDDVIDL